jgi:hypothetical protein
MYTLLYALCHRLARLSGATPHGKHHDNHKKSAQSPHTTLTQLLNSLVYMRHTKTLLMTLYRFEAYAFEYIFKAFWRRELVDRLR